MKQSDKHRRRTCANVGMQWVAEYCATTALPGYKYLSMEGLHFTERFLWALVLIAFVILAVYQVSVSLHSNYSRPTINALESSHFHVYNVPFPAITICDLNKLYFSDVLSLVNSMTLPNTTSKAEILEDMQILAQLLFPEETNLTVNITRVQKTIDMNNMSIETVMWKVMPSCKKSLAVCLWKGRVQFPCSRMFKKVKSSDGFCCSFNYKDLNEDIISKMNTKNIVLMDCVSIYSWEAWPVLRKIVDRKSIGRYEIFLLRFKNKIKDGPARSSSAGTQNGLTVVLRSNKKEYFKPLLSSYGYQVLLHSPFDYPNPYLDKRMVRSGNEMFFAILPTEYYSTSEVKKLPIGRRHCRFADEVDRKSLRYYSFNNCIMTCRMDLILLLCGCVPFYFPSRGDRTCNLTDIPCLARNQLAIESLHPNESREDGFEESHRFDKHPCECEPGCQEFSYRVDTSTSVLSNITMLSKEELYEGIDPVTDTVIHFFFVDLVGSRYRTSLFYTWLSLMGSLGGLLGLLLGFSFTAVLEAVYFFTVRPLFNVMYSSRTDLAADPYGLQYVKIDRSRKVAWGSRDYNT